MIQFIGPIGGTTYNNFIYPTSLASFKNKRCFWNIFRNVYYFCPWRYIMDCIWSYPS